MNTYIYDGSFDGLLTSIYEAYYRDEKPQEIVTEEDFQHNMFTNPIYITTDLQKAEKVYNAIRDKISNTALENVFYVFLSELEERGNWIYHYLRLGWKIGWKIDYYLSDNRVLSVHNIADKVKRERHRMLGLIRFRQLRNGLYYAPIETDYNIVGLVAPHFSKRMADQDWMIHDVKRNLAAIFNQQEWVITSVESMQELPVTDQELLYQQLWKNYFENIAIEDRKNSQLQKRNMPARYWKFLTEKI